MVVGLLEPGLEVLLEGVQGPDLAVGHLDKELFPHSPEKPLHLSPAFGAPGPAVDEPHAEHGQRPQQLAGHERAAVVQVDRAGQAPGQDAPAQRGLGGQGVLAVAPAVPGHYAAAVVQEGEQDGLLRPHHRPVQGVAGPQLVRVAQLGSGRRRRWPP